MKKLAYAIVLLLLCGTAMAQEKPTEVKEEAEVKTVKYKDNDGVHEKKVKVVKRETAQVKLDAEDANKVNQDRIASDKKIEKTVMADTDADDAYDTLEKETYFVSSDGTFKFTPNKKGFVIVSDEDTNKAGKAWEASNGYYLIRGDEFPNGIGHFNEDGNFVVEYYCTDSECIKTITYNKNNSGL